MDKIESLFQKAITEHKSKKYFKALAMYKEILKLNPSLAAVYNNIGLINFETKSYNESLKAYLEAIKINPQFVEAHTNLSALYNRIKNYDQSIYHCKISLRLNPNFSKTYTNLGNAYDEMGDYSNAEKAYYKSIELNPNSKESYNNLGNIYQNISKYDDAIKFYNKAISIDNKWFKSRTNLGLVFLLLEKFDLGFEYFESRLKDLSKNEYNIRLNSPFWKNEDLNNKKLLVLSEQGLGDIIMFSRYIFALKKEFNVDIIFQTQKKLSHLFEGSNIKVISETEIIPKHDFHCYLMSLPKKYYEKNKKLICETNFLNENKKLSKKWLDELNKYKSPRVGINWQGSAGFKGDKFRSIKLKYFNELFKIEKINFFSLQKVFGIKQIENFRNKKNFHEYSNKIDVGTKAFEDTAEIIRHLDLVITSCTSVAHLSSTMGVETWILLAKNPDWRWFLNKKKTPWYKNTLLFRQKKAGDWESLFVEVKQKLQKKYQLSK